MYVHKQLSLVYANIITHHSSSSDTLLQGARSLKVWPSVSVIDSEGQRDMRRWSMEDLCFASPVVPACCVAKLLLPSSLDNLFSYKTRGFKTCGYNTLAYETNRLFASCVKDSSLMEHASAQTTVLPVHKSTVPAVQHFFIVFDSPLIYS